ncbi:MAG: MOSC N-terminal beta barrel domain-containing protein [Polyangiales bacterium]
MLGVTGLFVYPLKSARGIALREATLSDRGFVHDRRFMAVSPDGGMLTQRTVPALARIETALTHDALRLSVDGLRAEVPLAPRPGMPLRVRVFQDFVDDAWDLGDTYAAFLTEALGQPARLVHMPDAARRPVNPKYAADGEGVGFADGFPYLLTSEASLEALNQVLEQPVGMERFRPNLVIRGVDAWAEDDFGPLRVGDVAFEAVKPCSRCVIINTDQTTGAREKGTLEGLSRTHLLEKRAIFGQNLLARGTGTVRVGDPVTLLPRG